MEKLARSQLLNRAIQGQIRLYITNNGLKPGDLLPPEGQIAVDLGVSRGSVREAIKALESLGIVEVRHGDGVRVRGFNFDSILELLSYGVAFDPDKIGEILQIRIWLEDAAIVDALAVLDEEMLEQMEVLLARWQVKAAANADTSEEDRAFHQLLYAGLGNASLSQLIDIFWLVYHSKPAADKGEDRDPLATVQAHRDLLAAIRRRDPQSARQRMRDHFRNLEKRMERFAQNTRRERSSVENGAEVL
jgi:DNA-binding FadR family transcriptional regulator